MTRLARGLALSLTLGGWLFAVDARTADASFDISNVTTTSLGGGLTQFIYRLNFSGAPQALTSGDYVTLYDVDGVQSIFNSTSTGTATTSPISIGSSLLGVTPSFFSAQVTDSASHLNYTFTYTGGTIAGSATFYVTLVSNVGTQALQDYAGQTTQSSTNTAKIFNAGIKLVTVASTMTSVPEPASVVLLGLGAAGCLGLSRTRRRAAPPRA